MDLSKEKLLDIVDKHPKTIRLFKEYENKTGNCILCNDLFLTLEDMSRVNNLNLDEVLVDLKGHINRR
ncbi:hypothetical protein SYNTR_0056 [Candidatus Syntrophocurvum alkaliphilum]|uniref:DUF1858 domain-containing protein n=1 Tax=Candidatus Syntrophocurvum alkaliphilum TaxID=2293317 RepID=A0A6I6DG21_9FIRM|nr:hypothetical protein [Candidatus Syntrophocurvum alkaliphilum]QGT98649.1 hypothetical protein SYNTR_0056 [Candidatus Syntrophocurvum alkaliphilum]